VRKRIPWPAAPRRAARRLRRGAAGARAGFQNDILATGFTELLYEENNEMKINIQLFASLREAVGTSQLSLEVKSGTTPRQVGELLAERFSGLRGHLATISFAVNGEIVPPETVLSDSCELALLPPVSGG
jgi:molybdopterin converting factor subunit 1